MGRKSGLITPDMRWVTRNFPVAPRATRRGGGGGGGGVGVGHSEGTSSESGTDSDVRTRAKLSSPPVDTVISAKRVHQTPSGGLSDAV
jgi:hypothetical protein